MKTVLVLLLFALLSGCGTFGTSHYIVEPFLLDGQQACCRISIQNGKEIGSLNARFKKDGDKWDIVLQEAGVKAFEGQRITADAVTGTIGNIIPSIPVDIAQ